MYEYQHGALFVLSLARRLSDSAPIEARDILKPARRHGGGRAWVSLLSIEKPGQ